MNAALALLFRRPHPRNAKTRLGRTLGPQASLSLQRLLLACALEDAGQWPGSLALCPAQARDAAWAAGLLAREALVLPQPEGDLGTRMALLDRELRSRGADRVLLIGSDVPGLRAEDYRGAARALEAVDVVYSPAADGGVTLMGASRPWPALHDLPWGTGDLRAALSARCAEAGLEVRLLPESFDVDEAADLARLIQHLSGDPRPARARLVALARGLL